MKRLITVLATLALILGCAGTAAAADGNVIYDGMTQDIIFQPGSDYSLTDLFPNFKDVMPGDTLTQQITVKNDQGNHVKVEISKTPRLLRSFNTLSQNLLLSCSPIHTPRMSFLPSMVMPRTT